MADEPEVRKVDTLLELTAVAPGDKLLINDISETNLAELTKLVKMENIKLFNSAQLSADVVDNAQIKGGAVTAAKLASDSVETLKIKDGAVTADKLAAGAVDAEASNLIYMQLFQLDEAIITTDPKAYFFVPSHFAGKKVKKLGIGIVSPATGITVTVALGNGTYGSVSGTTSAESAAVNYSLPGVFTKIPVKVTVSAGAIPKGLDFWFVVGK